MNVPSSSTKRLWEQATSLEDSSEPTSSSPNQVPTTKAIRLTKTTSSTAPLFCSLPPTCHPPHNTPTALADSNELEVHYAKYHAHVCEERGCAAVFPNIRLLELHQTECHNPLALIKKERGEKIFACHLETCPRKFLDPKKRRLHLIQAHGFPKEYFFAVTNKGVGGLLKKWGEGASMIRGSWKARDGQLAENVDDAMNTEDIGYSDNDNDDTDEEILSTGTVKDISTIEMQSSEMQHTAQRSQIPDNADLHRQVTAPGAVQAPDDELNGLTNSMSSLSLVPSSIRFGRGAKGGQFSRQSKSFSNRARPGQKFVRAPLVDTKSILDGSPASPESDANPASPDVSINIDGALEALRFEAPSNTTTMSLNHNGSVEEEGEVQGKAGAEAEDMVHTEVGAELRCKGLNDFPK
ncbi:uncharacterized protein FOMMEDRAFT_30705 [Fomitiporia mediterranea MF3/22]|uniref:uncharacterized protein n=1 Tax=Fomitiporia mediterranea (strain MF3/22) TaxID=694068 RepID=UPI0004408B0A|nr:uncharacterized protein FOMMEDRAFT_30705 [Fomitiporia mediterranea MF3/22]EJD00004.1 hypothetical protein FOMMEDRAFT_30705 [Fomitiporia mediterranea MF3/22]